MTVSRVINHPETVTDELKKLVHSAMKELNYIPNYAARALVQNRTQVVKLLILEEMDTTEPYYMNLLTGISRELDRHHYALQLVTRKSLNIGQCDGIIATGLRKADFEGLIKVLKSLSLYSGKMKWATILLMLTMKKEPIWQHVTSLVWASAMSSFGIDLDEPFERSREKGYLKAMEGSLKSSDFPDGKQFKSEARARKCLHPLTHLQRLFALRTESRSGLSARCNRLVKEFRKMSRSPAMTGCFSTGSLRLA